MNINRNIVLLLLYTIIFSNTSHIPAVTHQNYNSKTLTPENTHIFFDLDDVVLKKSRFMRINMVVQGLRQAKSLSWIKSLITFRKLSKAIKKKQPHINGLVYQALYLPAFSASKDTSNLYAHAPLIFNLANQSHQWIPGTRSIINCLKEKGYTIGFATNKDAPSFNLVDKVLQNKLRPLADTVIVAGSGNKDIDKVLMELQKTESNLPETYTKLLSETSLFFGEEGKKIGRTVYLGKEPKPSLAYFETMKKIAKEKNIIFIDDKDENVQAAQSHDRITGIKFKNPEDLAQQLKNLGILDANDLQKL